MKSAFSKGTGFRLIIDGANSGSFNMASDETLLNSLMENKAGPTLRFYRWSLPTLSLGYFQKLSDVDLNVLAGMGYDLVRRPTGGRAVLHMEEVTFCLTIPAGDMGLWDVFRWVHQGIGAGLRSLNIPAEVLAVGLNEDKIRTSACFASPARYELSLGGKKVAGTAQKRCGDFMLIHGSIPLVSNFHRLFNLLRFSGEEERKEALKKSMKKMTSVLEETGMSFEPEEVYPAMIRGFESAWGLQFRESEYTQDEISMIESLSCEKYGSAGWTERY